MLAISLHKLSGLSPILDFKGQYLRSLSAPLDGMWEVGLINPSPHWAIEVDGERAGYYAANDEGTLLQFYVRPELEQHRQAMFEHVIAQDALTQATVATIDPPFLSLCLDVQKKVTVNTYLYEAHKEILPCQSRATGLGFRPAKAAELDRVVAFQRVCLDSENDLTDWLQGYSAGLIKRKELFLLDDGADWLGLGECRVSDSQESVCDLGVMVAPAHRKKGWATDILSRLRAHSSVQGRQAICSTTIENVGAQKAIARAGFISRHRILNVGL